MDVWPKIDVSRSDSHLLVFPSFNLKRISYILGSGDGKHCDSSVVLSN